MSKKNAKDAHELIEALNAAYDVCHQVKCHTEHTTADSEEENIDHVLLKKSTEFLEWYNRIFNKIIS